MDTSITLAAYGDLVTDAFNVADSLGLSPCEALEYAFPAIVRNEEIMGALAALMDPAIAEVSTAVALGILDADNGERFVHNVFHLLQMAAALGHMVGIDEAMGTADAGIPDDLSDVAWDDLPDAFGEE
jgi:hypothetical protein